MDEIKTPTEFEKLFDINASGWLHEMKPIAFKSYRELYMLKLNLEEQVKALDGQLDASKELIANLSASDTKNREECENMLWNLAGCDTIASSGAPTKFEPSLARPALYAVNEMAKREVALKERVAFLEKLIQDKPEAIADDPSQIALDLEVDRRTDGDRGFVTTNEPVVEVEVRTEPALEDVRDTVKDLKDLKDLNVVPLVPLEDVRDTVKDLKDLNEMNVVPLVPLAPKLTEQELLFVGLITQILDKLDAVIVALNRPSEVTVQFSADKMNLG